jgi:hypothetical protein
VREKLNENPMAQVAIVLVLAVAAFLMLTHAGGGGSSEAGEEATPAESAGLATGASATVEPGVSGIPMVPAPPMPAPVAAAYQAGKTVVLLVVHDGGIDDRLVAASTKRLEAFPDTAIFIVPAKQIAHYGAITIGVSVQQVPALVVMRPRKLSEGAPQATVSYGFQTEQGIEQAMRDATYDGPEETYHPN